MPAIAKADLPKLNWQTVVVETMPPALLKKYNALRVQMEATETLRKEFEADMKTTLVKAKAIQEGQDMRATWNWGKLAIAIDDAEKIHAGKGNTRQAFTFGS